MDALDGVFKVCDMSSGGRYVLAVVLPKHEDWVVVYVLLKSQKMYPLGFTSPPGQTPLLHRWSPHHTYVPRVDQTS